MRSTAPANCPTTLDEYDTAPEPTAAVVVVVVGGVVELLFWERVSVVLDGTSPVVVEVDSPVVVVAGESEVVVPASLTSVPHPASNNSATAREVARFMFTRSDEPG